MEKIPSRPSLLDGYLTERDIANEFYCSIRTVQRMVQKRELAFTNLGRRKLIVAESVRELLLSREVKPIAERRGRR